ncbi:MAG: hypothetical protein IJ223_02090 [Clostridia bacterium]|nr:hypothetical protein [Clostridia bacterium]
MKKQTILIIILLIVVILIVAFLVAQNVQKSRILANYNNQYEVCKTKNVYGTDIATLINMAIDNNEKNNIPKDDKDYYIPDDENSVKIYLKLQEEGENFPMERIFKLGIIEFVKNFNLETFKCTKINYHLKTGKVSEVYFEYIQN